MITKEAAQAFLETKKLENPVVKKLAKVKQLEGNAQLLGRLILNDVKDYEDEQEEGYWYRFGDKRQTAIEDLLKGALKGKNIWDGPYEKTILAIFGDWATYIIKAWDLQTGLMYQSGYYRRSYRSPNNPETMLSRKVKWLVRLANNLVYDLSLADYVKYYAYLRPSPTLCYVWAAAIEEDTAEGKQILAILLDTIYGRDDVAAVNREAIKALLLTETPTAWEAVEKLLLSAQRQEGLRQSILESLDETSLPAFIHFIKIVLANNLLRFSAIKRAVGVWTGLAWEAAREKTIQRAMTLAYDFLINPSTTNKALKSKDNLEIYMALWAKGCIDIDATFPAIRTLLENGDDRKKLVALWFLTGVDLPKPTHDLIYPYLADENLMIAGLAFQNTAAEETKKNTNAYDTLLQLWQRNTSKEVDFSGKLFTWNGYKYQPSEVMGQIVNLVGETEPEKLFPYYDQMDLSSRESLARYLVKREKLKPVHRSMIFRLLSDKGQWIRSMTLEALKKWDLEGDENQSIESTLTRTSGDLRVGAIELLFKQPDIALLGSIERLLVAKKINQRLAGLDLLRQLVKKDRLKTKALALAATYKENKKISAKEDLILSDILASDGIIYSAENGFGLYDPNNLTISPNPKLQPHLNFEWEEKRIFKAVKALDALIEKHKEYEYEVTSYDNTKSSYLLGNNFTSKTSFYRKDNLSPREIFETLPLAAVWDKWYQESGLTPWDLRLLNLTNANYHRYYQIKDWAEKIFFHFYKSTTFLEKAITPTYQRHHRTILSKLGAVYPVTPQAQTELDICEAIFAAIPEDKWNEPITEENRWSNKQDTWRDYDSFNFLKKVFRGTKKDSTEKNISRIWHLANWRYQSNEEKKDEDRPDLAITAKAYQLGIINEHDLFSKIFNSSGSLEQLTGFYRQDVFDTFPFLKPILDNCRDRILEIELKRGDSKTLVSDYATALKRIEGIPYLVEILQALGKDTISQNSYYASSNNKKEVISLLLKNSFPKKEETTADFKVAISKTKVTEQRLLDIAMYAPQWIPFVSDYLKWKGLESAVWWFHAHTKDSSYSYNSNQLESDISRYSPLKAEALVDGAVDVKWFYNAYKTIGKKRWEQLYKSAKYVSSGSGHKRAQTFADAMIGKLKLRATVKVINEKRRQDYVRALGLIPLNKKTPDKDLLKRYQLIQKFKKESKQFGSQRQVSEGLAVKISLENLARTAGYPDPIRLTWAMETKEAKAIINAASIIQKGAISIELSIDGFGKAKVVATKDGKILNAIPAKHRKDKAVLQLKAAAKTLQNQYRRTKKALEAAMCRRDSFEIQEIQLLSTHPVVHPMLKDLVLAVKNQQAIGYFDQDHLLSPNGERHALSAKDEIMIAHCTDLHQSGLWSAFQKDCFAQKRIQPFKQIFRELYLPTSDELQEKTISRRYAGHQVNPKQTVALLKTRGWTVDRDTGLQKVYHEENCIVRLYALADWFTPSDIEAPTLEVLHFEYRDTYKKVPFEEIPPHVFSEVMRDVDLVVSVAHVGGVDPEASHSTIEMRKVLVTETTSLLSLDNIEFKDKHLLIKGEIGAYSLHLGSGVIHRQPGGYISVIPVHSQRRGRIFLPFMDEDPKSAEILSKVLLLAEDQKIKDPTIIRQLVS